MLTRQEIEGAHEVLYEQKLEALGEAGLRDALGDGSAFMQLMPPHMGEREARRIAEDKLTELVARRSAAAGEAAQSEASPTAASVFDWFWAPVRKVFNPDGEKK